MSRERPFCLIGMLALALVAQARAEISGSVGLLSDYRFRGVSLSDERPAAQLGVNYDHPGGAYAGLFASTTRFANQSGDDLQVLGYLGYARRTVSNLSWEAGALYSAFAGYYGYNYAEFYLGLARDGLNGRIYFSPDYFGQGVRTVYGELNGTQTLFGPLSIVAHVGALHASAEQTGASGYARYHYDLRAGMAVQLARARIELTALRARPDPAVYPISHEQKRNSVVLGVSWSM